MASPKFSEENILPATGYFFPAQARHKSIAQAKGPHSAATSVCKGADESYHFHAPFFRHVAPRHSHDVSKLFRFLFSSPRRLVCACARSSAVAVEDHSFVPRLESVFLGNTFARTWAWGWLMARVFIVSKKASWAFGVLFSLCGRGSVVTPSESRGGISLVPPAGVTWDSVCVSLCRQFPALSVLLCSEMRRAAWEK